MADYTIGNGDLFIANHYIGLLTGDVVLSVQDELNELKAGRPARTVAVSKVSEGATLSASAAKISPYNLALALNLPMTEVAESTGSVTDQELTVSELPETFFVGHFALTGVSVTDSTGATTYVEGTDYSLDAANGRITILEGGGISVGGTIKVSYGYTDPAKYRITYGGSASIAEPKELVFIHEKPDGKKIIITFYKAQVGGAIDFTFSENDWITVPMTFTAIYDETRQLGDQLYKIEIES